MFSRFFINRPIFASVLSIVIVLGGSIALFTLPVAYHCLWSLGFQDASTRVLLHSLFGCAVYGAFAAKVLIVRSPGTPGWALPLAGATMFTTLVVVWLTSVA